MLKCAKKTEQLQYMQNKIYVLTNMVDIKKYLRKKTLIPQSFLCSWNVHRVTEHVIIKIQFMKDNNFLKFKTIKGTDFCLVFFLTVM